MREKRNAQTSLFDPQSVDLPVADDLGAPSASGRGRRGPSCETVLRCAVLKHLRQESYRGLEFALRDSLSARRFARIDGSRLPGKSALPAVTAAGTPWARSWAETAAEYGELLVRVVDQTKRRVFEGEAVPVPEKVVSLFEPHTDIIVKGGCKTHYGHKVNFATGRGGLVLDAVVEDGNSADSARCPPMLRRHVERHGAAPSRAAFDGGYASRGNLIAAKDLGVEHVVFQKKSGLKVADMTPSSWICARLKRFRAGVEAGISHLKRCFGLGRCRGLPRFKACVRSAVFAHNLMRLVRLLPRPT